MSQLLNESIARLLTALLVGLAALVTASPAWSQGSPIDFSAIGDVPYSAAEEDELQQHVVDHNLYSSSAFLVHLGDLKGGDPNCTESDYTTAANLLGGLAVPTFVVPGDNEWTDCIDPVQAWAWWTTHFLGFEQSFCGAPAVESQPVRPENFAFVENGVLFVGINHVGGTNQDPVEQAARLVDDADWVQQQMQGKSAVVRAAVIFAQESPRVEPFETPFRAAAAAFGKPVLYIHGDNHEWKLDSPFPEPNILRVQVERGTLAEPPIRVTVTMDRSPTGAFLIERDPWPAGTQLLNRAPCVDAGPDLIADIAAPTILDGLASDDGVPSAALATTWSPVSGPGFVALSDPAALSTTATFGAPGTYHLRLEASDGAVVTASDVYVLVRGSSGEDADGDGADDDVDTCPAVSNPGQADFDADGFGDDCDPDRDGDGFEAGDDCDDGDPGVNPSPLTAENCSDTIDNNCDGSVDGADLQCGACPAGFDPDLDGICSWDDLCPDEFDPSQADLDGDGFGDACDVCPESGTINVDPDGDGLCVENCPAVPNPTQDDGDGDGVGDVCDACLVDGSGGVCAPLGIELDLAIGDGADDAEEREETGAVTLTSSDIELGNDQGNLQIAGLRFSGLGVPQGSVIHRAYLQLQVDEASTGPASVVIEAEAADHSSPFSVLAGDLSSRVRGAGWVGWSPPDWPVIGERGARQRSPDLSSLIQEVVDRPGWVGGSALTLLISALDEASARTAESRDGMTLGAPALHVEYTPMRPTVSIASPADGSTSIGIEPVTFSGSADDAQDGDVTESLVWESNVDGAIGSGAGFTLSTLSIGTHVITATATDGEGNTGAATITITVNAPPEPVVTISSPADGAAFTESDPVNFSGLALDAKDGDVTASLVWDSDLDGEIGTGASFTLATLSPGSHVITATATDSESNPGAASLGLTVNANVAPVVGISTPADGATVLRTDVVSFEGSATDAEDGDLGSALTWTSSLDGSIGSGESFALANLTVGAHQILASVIDAHGASGSAAISLNVEACAPGIDPDGDEVCDGQDNCPLVSNPDQADADGDGLGDVCDVCPTSATISVDPDGDGVCVDNCPAVANPGQEDGDGDGVGDVCDACAVDGIGGTCTPLGETFDVSVASGVDDAEEKVETGVVTLGSLDLDLVLSGNEQGIAALRFQGVAIPQGASIHRAHLQLRADEIDPGPASLIIEAEASDDSTPFSEVSGDLSSRARSAAWAGWSPPDWLVVGEEGPGHRSSDLSDVVQEIVTRPGWASGAALTLIISALDPASNRTAQSADVGALGAPSLHVEFSPPEPVVTITAPGDGSSWIEGHVVAFAGSASDPQEGDVTASLVWDSNLDGVIGTGAGFSLSTLSPGSHVITATATDSGGHEGSAAIALVVDPNTAPQVAISAPLNGSSSLTGAPLTFTGSASDTEDGDLSATLSWTSNLVGAIGSGASFTTSTLPEGSHVVTASVVDAQGLEGFAAVTTIRLPEPGSEGLLVGLFGLGALARRRRLPLKTKPSARTPGA
jgi:hypothetical protein